MDAEQTLAALRELHWPVWQARQAAREALYRVYEAKRG